MVRVGARIGPFYVSTSSRSRRRRRSYPTASQRRAQAAVDTEKRRQREAQATAYQARVSARRAQRRTTYGPYRLDDFRTWLSWQWFWSLTALGIIASLPVMIGDGPLAEGLWVAALAAGVVVYGVRVARLHAAQAPQRRAAAEQAAVERRNAELRAAAERGRLRAEAARQAAERQAFLAPRLVGNAWHHGACTINHRTIDTALRCQRS